MRVPRRLPLLVVLSIAVLLLCGCTEDRSSGRPAASRLGGRVPTSMAPPAGAMNSIERPVAERLSQQLSRDGLTLQGLDCPRWDKALPRQMTCVAYVDGLAARVRVALTGSPGGQVGFDAWLTDGMVATGKLERTLRGKGWTDPDCGEVAAYPARPGSRIRCRVTRAGRDGYVVATVVDRAGRVTITADRGAPAG